MESFWARFAVGSSCVLADLGVAGRILEGANSNAESVGLLGLDVREGLWLMALGVDVVMSELALRQETSSTVVLLTLKLYADG
jgi:uncharacterized ferredoxin-like protein